MTQTPSELFNELLAKAELRFGPRTRSLNIEVVPRSHLTPETITSGPDGCIVHYFEGAASDRERLSFQLGHEAIHVLSGAFVREARMLEEGLAVSFSLDAVTRNYRRRTKRGEGISLLFLRAFRSFENLKATDAKITEFRQQCPNLDNATPQLIAGIFIVDPQVASELCQRVPPDMHLR